MLTHPEVSGVKINFKIVGRVFRYLDIPLFFFFKWPVLSLDLSNLRALWLEIQMHTQIHIIK